MTYYTRADWGAKPPIQSRPISDSLRGVVVHWTGTLVVSPRDTVVAVQRYHMQTKGWWDCAYNEYVDLNGDAWEGRGLLLRTGANGTLALNKRYISICCLMGPGQLPTDAMVAGIRERIRVIRHYQPQATEVLGHLDIRPTDCPGPDVYDLVKRRAFEPGSTITIAPSPPDPLPYAPKPPPVVQPVDELGALRATVEQLQAWQVAHQASHDG